jgi:hypothetical protein
MSEVLRTLLNWSEFWAPLIPITVFLMNRKQPDYMKSVVRYFAGAAIINLYGNIISSYWRQLPDWMQSNTILYNIHSIFRFTCFSLFFINLHQKGTNTIYRLLPLLSLLIFILNFTFIDDFFNQDHLSGNLLAGEAYLLLIYCMVYYLFKLRDDDLLVTQEPDFWIVTGLAIYVVVNFFVFLFYVPMINYNIKLALSIWDVHNYAYLILCLLTAKALYDAPRYQPAV